AIYAIASMLYGRRAGLITLALLVTSPSFVLTSHLGRHDIIVAALGYGAIALYLWEQARPSPLRYKSVLAGLAIGLSLDIHLNGMIFVPAMMALFLCDQGWRT